ncbi:MAG: UDP-N-acetylmuramate dehydrogenase, partial [Anaerolineales bacterium]
MTKAQPPNDLRGLLKRAFGRRFRRNAPLAPFTSARIGGPADYLLEVRSEDQLAEALRQLWEWQLPVRVLGGGSNVLVADAGFRGVVVLNKARAVRFEEPENGPRVWAESGASLGVVARRSVDRGWAGLEWAAGIPGTIGGAVVGNAGAHGSDVASCLEMANILQLDGSVEPWGTDRLLFAYRDSWLKRNPGQAVVLSATFGLERSSKEKTKAAMEKIAAHRKRTQPRGASWGSMFKNPPGDFAGRLIEAAGLKGMQQGQAQISQKHANFFLNLGGATADDAWKLIQIARRSVAEKFGVILELEVEL